MRLGWAIQSSWTNGVRMKLTRPICGTLRGQAFFWLRVFPAPQQSQRPTHTRVPITCSVKVWIECVEIVGGVVFGANLFDDLPRL